MSRIGSTISFLGKPSRKASRIIPSSPSARPSGSSAAAPCARAASCRPRCSSQQIDEQAPGARPSPRGRGRIPIRSEAAHQHLPHARTAVGRQLEGEGGAFAAQQRGGQKALDEQRHAHGSTSDASSPALAPSMASPERNAVKSVMSSGKRRCTAQGCSSASR